MIASRTTAKPTSGARGCSSCSTSPTATATATANGDGNGDVYYGNGYNDPKLSNITYRVGGDDPATVGTSHCDATTKRITPRTM